MENNKENGLLKLIKERVQKEKNRPKEVFSVQNCTQENEKIVEGFSTEKPYLTTTIIKFTDD